MRVDEHTINLDESPVFYRRSAETPEVPVLYLHGIPTSSDDWVDFLDRTGGIAPDLVGFGRSGKGGHLDYSVTGLTGFVERFLAELRVDAVRLVAHDWGVPVGLALAHRHPEQVQRLVLLNAPPLFDGFAWPRLARWWRARLIGEGLMGSTTQGMLARTLRHGSVRDDAWPDARVAAVWDQFDQGTQRAILRLVRSAWETSDGGAGDPEGPSTRVGAGDPEGSGPPLRAGDPRTDPKPALIIWGDRDPWYPPALADAYAAQLPMATVERVADAGHWPWLDRTDLIERVAAFLEQ